MNRESKDAGGAAAARAGRAEAAVAAAARVRKRRRSNVPNGSWAAHDAQIERGTEARSVTWPPASSPLYPAHRLTQVAPNRSPHCRTFKHRQKPSGWQSAELR